MNHYSTTVSKRLLSDDPDAFHKKYKFGSMLGKGAFGKVMRAYKRDNDFECAVKVFLRVDKHSELKKTISTEVDALERLSHPHVVEFIEIIEDPMNSFLVLEMVGGGKSLSMINFVTINVMASLQANCSNESQKEP